MDQEIQPIPLPLQRVERGIDAGFVRHVAGEHAIGPHRRGQRTHAPLQRLALEGEGEFGALGGTGGGNTPGQRTLVRHAHDQATLALQQRAFDRGRRRSAVGHGRSFVGSGVARRRPLPPVVAQPRRCGARAIDDRLSADRALARGLRSGTVRPFRREDQSMPDSSPLVTNPFAQFHEWMAEAWTHEPEDANAMTLATTTPDGTPSARIVLLKGADDRGFVFYTNKQSRKGEELAANARAALLFHWKPQGRQVRIEGRVEHVTDCRGGRLLRHARAHFAAGRLGVGPVPSAGRTRGTGTPPGGSRGEVPRRGYPAPAALVGLPGHPGALRVLAEHAVPAARPHRLHEVGERRLDRRQAVSLTEWLCRRNRRRRRISCAGSRARIPWRHTSRWCSSAPTRCGS